MTLQDAEQYASEIRGFIGTPTEQLMSRQDQYVVALADEVARLREAWTRASAIIEAACWEHDRIQDLLAERELYEGTHDKDDAACIEAIKRVMQGDAS